MVYAIIFVLVFSLIVGGVFYIIYNSWQSFDPSIHGTKGAYYAKQKAKQLGPGHGIQTPYGPASSNGAASVYVGRTRNK